MCLAIRDQIISNLVTLAVYQRVINSQLSQLTMRASVHAI